MIGSTYATFNKLMCGLQLQMELHRSTPAKLADDSTIEECNSHYGMSELLNDHFSIRQLTKRLLVSSLTQRTLTNGMVTDRNLPNNMNWNWKKRGVKQWAQRFQLTKNTWKSSNELKDSN